MKAKIVAVVATGIIVVAAWHSFSGRAFGEDKAPPPNVMPGPKAEETPVPPKAQAPGNVDERISRLEARIRELEARLEKKAEDLPGRKRRPAMDDGDFDMLIPTPHGLQEHMDQLRRRQRDLLDRFWGDEMGKLGPGYDWNFPGALSRQKPRLGVGMAPVSGDLKAKYGNDVASGVFVVEVHDRSPAEAAGIREGDCIVSFAGRAVASPDELAEAVREAPAGRVDVKLVRGGREIAAKVDLPDARGIAPWGGIQDMMRRFKGPEGEHFEFEVDSDSLKLSGDLAKKMKLTEEQKKRVEEILAKARTELSEEIVRESMQRRQGGGMWGLPLRLDDDAGGKVKSKEAQVEKDLSGFLSPEQMETYRKERAASRRTSIRRMFILRQGQGSALPQPDQWERPDRERKDDPAEIQKRERF